DPTFVYTQQMARVFGLAVLRMAQSDVLPYDYENYGREVAGYLEAAQKRAEMLFAGKGPNFAPALAAARRFTDAGAAITSVQQLQSAQAAAATTGGSANAMADRTAALNTALLAAERALLLPQGLPNRPWFRHAIYAPGQYTGYEAVVIPGVNEALDKAALDKEALKGKDGAPSAVAAQQQLAALAAALNNAAAVLETAAKP